ncbi:uncharacterized protein LOC116246785 [Nymphaea colorata]|nr:uncharacterized protein LOC116246785 [Nymphaea colorata]
MSAQIACSLVLPLLLPTSSPFGSSNKHTVAGRPTKFWKVAASFSRFNPKTVRLRHSVRISDGFRKGKCQAAGEGARTGGEGSVVYQGMYGPWSIDAADVREVILYRSGLVTASATLIIAGSAAFLPDGVFKDFIRAYIDLLYAIGAGGLGLSLALIHIYVTPIKRTLQAFWVLGAIGSLVTYLTLAQPAGESLTQYVINQPTAVWFVGPLFAALTGLVFKEGLCYGKLEAGVLTFLIPTVLLGHLTGLANDNVKISLLAVWMLFFMIFASRKFTQPIKDDIGDKSVFMFNSLPEEEKKALVMRLEQLREKLE